jgi:hypothetical protein
MSEYANAARTNRRIRLLRATPVGGFAGHIRGLKVGCKPLEETPPIQPLLLNEIDDNRRDEETASCASHPDSLSSPTFNRKCIHDQMLAI